MVTVPIKCCSTCRRDLPTTEFHRRTRSKDGLQANCKPCALKATANWWTKQGNAAQLAYHARWRANHPDYRDKNRRAALAWYYRHREEAIRRVIAYRALRKAELREYTRQWLKANTGKTAEYNHSRRARERSVLRIRFAPEQLAAKMAYWGNCCWLCRIPATHIDHVKPLSKGGPHVLANLRPICKSCNSRKRNKWPLSLV